MVLSESVLMGPRTVMPADFERQSAILIGVNQLLPHHPQVLTGLVSALIDRIPIVAVITDEEQRRDLLTTLCDWGLPAHRVRAVRSPAVGLWVRDYGPAFVKRDGRVCALDAEYNFRNDSRPHDDLFPTELARLLDVDVTNVPLRIEGGNILSNGRGLLLTTWAVLHRNKQRYTHEQALKQLCSHYGFRQVACMPSLVDGRTHHSDMFATFTSADTVVIGRYDKSDDPANAAMLDKVADSMRGMDSGAGPLKVERIPMPPHRDGVWRTYTNAVYVNDAVIVPVYAGVDERIEREALDTYRRLLPGRQVLTVDATSLAKWGGALRCATLNIPHLGHPMAFDDVAAQPFARAGELPRASRIDSFVTSGGWFGPRRSVLRMDV